MSKLKSPTPPLRRPCLGCCLLDTLITKKSSLQSEIDTIQSELTELQNKGPSLEGAVSDEVLEKLQLSYEKSNERWTKIEKNLEKASYGLLSLQQKAPKIKGTLDKVMKVMQASQTTGRSLLSRQQDMIRQLRGE